MRVGAKTRLDRSITLIIAEPKLTTTNQPSFTTHNNNNNYNTRVQGGCSKLQAKSPVTEGLFVHLGELISRAGPACAPVRSARGGPRPRLFVGRALDGGQGLGWGVRALLRSKHTHTHTKGCIVICLMAPP